MAQAKRSKQSAKKEDQLEAKVKDLEAKIQTLESRLQSAATPAPVVSAPAPAANPEEKTKAAASRAANAANVANVANVADDAAKAKSTASAVVPAPVTPAVANVKTDPLQYEASTDTILSFLKKGCFNAADVNTFKEKMSNALNNDRPYALLEADDKEFVTKYGITEQDYTKLLSNKDASVKLVNTVSKQVLGASKLGPMFNQQIETIQTNPKERATLRQAVNDQFGVDSDIIPGYPDRLLNPQLSDNLDVIQKLKDENTGKITKSALYDFGRITKQLAENKSYNDLTDFEKQSLEKLNLYEGSFKNHNDALILNSTVQKLYEKYDDIDKLGATSFGYAGGYVVANVPGNQEGKWNFDYIQKNDGNIFNELRQSAYEALRNNQK